MKRLAAAAALAATALLATGCANVTVQPSPTATTVESLRAARLAPAQVGTFQLAPDKPAAMDTSLSGLRGNSVAPSKGSWSQHLKDTLATELSAAGLLDPNSSVVIQGWLTDSKVDAAISTGTGRVAARFRVTRDGQVRFDKELAADGQWESSFMGAVAIPAAINQYSALYKKLVGKLVDDPDFRRALAR